MKVIEINASWGCAPTIDLGQRGENLATEVRFDFSSWAEEFGAPGAVELYVRRSGEGTAYPVALAIDGTTAVWSVSSVDTHIVGFGEAEFVYLIDETVVKTAVYGTTVEPDIGEPADDPPNPYESWMEELGEMAADTLINAQRAETAQDGAEAAQTAAEAAQSAAETAQTAAEAAQTGAEAAQTAAETAQAAAESAQTGAQDAETRAERYRNDAEGFAVQSMDNARAAAASATTAQTAATTATQKATAAANSASSAATSASTATQKANAAANSASIAQDWAGQAIDSAQTAETASDNAQTYASNASASATAAANSATAAAASASAAAASETAADTSATAAAASESAAEAAQAAAEAVLESIPEDYTELSNTVGETTGDMAIDVSRSAGVRLYINGSTLTTPSDNSKRSIAVPAKGLKSIHVTCSVSSTKRIGFVDSVSSGATVYGRQDYESSALDTVIVNEDDHGYLFIQYFVNADTEHDIAVYIAATTVTVLSAVDVDARDDAVFSLNGTRELTPGDYGSTGWTINASGLFRVGSAYNSIAIPRDALWSGVLITARSTANAYVSFFNADPPAAPTDRSSAEAYLCEGDVRYVTEAAETNTFSIPDDCTWLIVMTNGGGANTTPETLAAVSPVMTEVQKNTARIDALEPLAPTVAELVQDTHYYVDQSSLGWTYGGINNTGKSTDYRNRIRMLTANGKGAFAVGAGSTITANSGYQFACAMYSSYKNNSNFTLIDYRALGTGSYTIPQDCYIRIMVATTANDALWKVNDDRTREFTEAGEAAKTNALTMTLYAGTVKDAIENLQETAVDIWSTPARLDDELPLNALEYHALFDGLVDSGFLTRELLGNADNDEDYPVYLYTLRNDMAHMSSSYDVVAWDGTNELYERPKVFLDSGLHGNERTTPVALWHFIDRLCTQPEYQGMRNAFDWYFIPLCNPWGFSHSSISNATGNVENGSHYNSSTLSSYTAVANTSTVHQGIRRNKAGIDINRDFVNFATLEAQYMRDAVDDLTEDGRNFVFACDAHQSATGSAVNAVGAFLSLHYGATDEAKALIWSKWMQAGALSEMLVANETDSDVVQSVYAWDGTNADTMRNYMKDYADYSMCFEGGQTCAYYSGSTVWSNRIARMFTDTQYQNFMHILTAEWM